jgi:DNA-binding beta-propeller fold protein YncE
MIRSNIHQNTKWIQNGFTVAGGNGDGDAPNQLNDPIGIYVDDDQTIYIADCGNHRIVEWKYGATDGRVVAGGNGQASNANQLDYPRDVVFDKNANTLLICDRDNRRVVQWPLRNGTSGRTIISNIDCSRLTLDDNGYLYVSDYKKHEVRRWKIGEANGVLVAGGNGKGIRLNQLNQPTFVFVDQNQSVYVSDWGNHRVMKWVKDAKEGIVVAGGQGQGNGLAQLSEPTGVIVDHLGAVYVADYNNHRIMRWCRGAREGNIVLDRNGVGKRVNQLSGPVGLSFDRQGNLYVVDCDNHRVQRFDLDRS